MNLPELIATAKTDIQPLVDGLNGDLLPGTITRYNSEYGLRYFGRPGAEEIPTEKRRLTEFRGRLGTLIEYGLGVTMDSILQDDYGPALRMSFVVSHQYPDFFVRGPQGEVTLRIDCKALHDESAEYSARFDLKTSLIDPSTDLILYVAWRWAKGSLNRHELVYPHVVEGLFIPAIEVAQERDRHLILRGGRFTEAGVPVVPPNDQVDTNFGKINRVVHNTRDLDALTSNVRAFVEFTRRNADAVRAAAASADGLTADEINPHPG